MTFINKKIKAALYTRVSTEEQRKEGFSLSAQEDVLRDYCASKGFEVFDVYEDGGYSGKDFNRPKFQKLLRDLHEDKFDVVLSIAVDRISRNNRNVLAFIEDELEPRDKKLMISTCDIDSSTVNGKMFISLLGTFAEYERKLIVSRVKDGMEKRASAGLANGGRMLGYDYIDKKLVVNADEADIVKRVFEFRAENKGYKWIAQRLNESGKKTKNNKSFSINTIKTILQNDKYIGNMSWGKLRDWNNKRRKGKSDPTVCAGEHEAIIDMDLWNKVQAINKLKSEIPINQSNFKGEFVLSGLLRCPVCGSGTVMSKKPKRDGSGYHLYYMCQNYHSKGKTACGSNLVKKELVEQQVLGFIRTILSDETIVEEIMIRLKSEDANNILTFEKDLNLQKINLKKIQDKQSKQDSDYYASKISANVYNRLSAMTENELNECNQIIEYLNKEIENTKPSVIINQKVIIEALQNFDVLYEGATNKEKRSLLRALIKEVHMEADRKSIKNIVFWFSEDDLLLKSALPLSEVRGTLS